MPRLPRPRLIMPLASVCALVAVAAGGPHAAGVRTRAVHITDAAAPPLKAPDRFALRDRFEVRGRDVITVQGTKCPKSHPHKIGSSSSSSSTQVNGGPITSRSHHSVVCAR